jgi:glycosyltransferase involved in cell wall biosynthesis
MSVDQETEPRLTVLLQEYTLVIDAIRRRTAVNEKVMGFGLTIVAATFTIGLKETVFEVFLFIPLALLWLITYVVYLYTEVMTYGGYCKHLEGRINELCGGECLKFETHLAPKIHHKFANYPFQIVGFFSSLVVVALCLYQIYLVSPTLLWWYGALYSVLLLLTVGGATKVYGQYDLVYRLSESSVTTPSSQAMQRKRIAIFTPQLPPQHGGVGQTAFRIAVELAKDDEVWLLVPRPHAALASKISERIRASGTPTLHLQFIPSQRHSWLTKLILGAEVLNMAYLPQHHRKQRHLYTLETLRPDAAIVIDPLAFVGMPMIGGYRKPVATEYCEANNIPVLAYYHSHYVGALPYYPLLIRAAFGALFRHYTRQILTAYRHVIVFSSYMRDQLADLGVQHVTMMSIEGLELEKWVQKPVQKIADGTLRIIFFGRLMREKDIAKMVEVFLALDKLDISFKATIIGSGPERPRLAKLQSALNIELIDWVEHAKLIEHVAEADAYINCSSFETLCLSMAEAMALSCVPVVSSHGGHTGLITQGIEGFMCSSVQDFVDALVVLSRDRMARVTMAHAARQRIIREFDLRRNIRNLRQALNTRDASPGQPILKPNVALQPTCGARLWCAI